MEFVLQKELAEAAGDLCIGLVVAEGIDNRTANPKISALLQNTVSETAAALAESGGTVKSLPELQPYQKAMKAMEINPGKYLSSIESMLTRVSKKGELPSFSPVIDLSNALSLKYRLPLGAHDMDKLSGDMEVRFSKEEDTSTDSAAEPFAPGEPVYVSGGQVRTRKWIWRQTETGRLDETATRLVFPIDGFHSNREKVIAARDELARLLEEHFGCTVRVGMVDKERPSFKLSGLTEEEAAVEDALKIILKGVAEHTAVDDIRERLLESKRTGRPLRIKLGLDPSAPDIHLGHSVVLRKIKQLQDLGHKAIIIIGDYTGRIGDPSGKSKTRKPLTEEQVLANAKTYETQIFKILDKSKTDVHFNSEWLSKMNFADVLSLAAKCTVARMLERDDFQKRYTSHQTISVHEFFYPLMQAYDSVAIEADFELGGTDQIFNVLMGRNIQRDYGQQPQITLFMPLLEGLDGVEKMSKSLGNYIGIDEEPAVIFEKVMKIPDHFIIKYYNLCTDVHPDEVERIQQRLDSGENPRDIKIELAREITALYGGAESVPAAEDHFVKAYQQQVAPDDTPVLAVSGDGTPGDNLINSLLETGAYKSKSEIRRLFQQNAISIGGEKVRDPQTITQLTSGSILQIGKGRFFKIQL